MTIKKRENIIFKKKTKTKQFLIKIVYPIQLYQNYTILYVLPIPTIYKQMIFID